MEQIAKVDRGFFFLQFIYECDARDGIYGSARRVICPAVLASSHPSLGLLYDHCPRTRPIETAYFLVSDLPSNLPWR